MQKSMQRARKIVAHPNAQNVNKMNVESEHILHQTEETCLEEILDFYHCMDHCAGPKIFAKLK